MWRRRQSLCRSCRNARLALSAGSRFPGRRLVRRTQIPGPVDQESSPDLTGLRAFFLRLGGGDLRRRFCVGRRRRIGSRPRDADCRRAGRRSDRPGRAAHRHPAFLRTCPAARGAVDPPRRPHRNPEGDRRKGFGDCAHAPAPPGKRHACPVVARRFVRWSSGRRRPGILCRRAERGDAGQRPSNRICPCGSGFGWRASCCSPA